MDPNYKRHSSHVGVGVTEGKDIRPCPHVSHFFSPFSKIFPFAR